MLDEGCSTWETSGRFNTLGSKPRRADKCRHQNLRRTLRAEALAGRAAWFKNSKTNKTDTPPVGIEFEPILERSRWDDL